MMWWQWIILYMVPGICIGPWYAITQYRKEVANPEVRKYRLDNCGSRVALKGAERVRAIAKENLGEGVALIVIWPLYLAVMLCFQVASLISAGADLLARKELTALEQAEADARAAKIVAEYRTAQEREFEALDPQPKQPAKRKEMSYAEGGVIPAKHRIDKRWISKSYDTEQLNWSCFCGHSGYVFNAAMLPLDFEEHKARREAAGE
jgi:hypothetical protein